MRSQRSRSIRPRSVPTTAWGGEGAPGKVCGGGGGGGAGAGPGPVADVDAGTGCNIGAPNPWGSGMDMEGKCGYEGRGCDDDGSGCARRGPGFDDRDEPPGREVHAWAAGECGSAVVDFTAALAAARRPRRVNGRFGSPIS